MSESAEGNRAVVVERVFPHSAEKVWRALTESPLVSQWLMKNDFEAAPRKKFQFRADPVPHWDGIIDCEVLVVDPLKQLSYTWRSMGLDSVVLWTLTPADGGTRVRMEQSGFRPGQTAAYQGASYGWQRFFTGLEHLLGGLA